MITINVEFGNSYVKQDDIDRAEAAAWKVLGRVDEAEAFAEYMRQFNERDSEDGMTGLAALWVDVNRAAAGALTEGWYNRDGAGCSVSAS